MRGIAWGNCFFNPSNFLSQPSPWLATKARAYKIAGQKGSPGVKESVRE